MVQVVPRSLVQTTQQEMVGVSFATANLEWLEASHGITKKIGMRGVVFQFHALQHLQEMVVERLVAAIQDFPASCIGMARRMMGIVGRCLAQNTVFAWTLE